MPDGPFYFAWSGGITAEQVTVVTTGNTHGGQVREITIVGDIEDGKSQITNIGNLGTLVVGKLYLPQGDGITPGTIFIYDETVLSNGAINLSVPATETRKSATFAALEAVPLYRRDGQTAADSSFVDFGGPLDLMDGIYGISGPGIGYTWVPGTDNTQTLPVPSAWFAYHGDGLVPIWTFAGNPDDVGNISVDPEGVFATGTAHATFTITGFANDDWSSGIVPWYQVTNIPSEALAGLTEGARYNISGNGIPVGTTFIAPAPGATSIELDQSVASAEDGAILTITGPRSASEPFDPDIHLRFDEEVLSIAIEQSEGDFATLTIEIKNSGIGYLATGRNLWCWLSIAGDPDPIPLFNGRLVGIPRLATDEIIQLQFLARPEDYNTQKQALANSMMVLPAWDPVWLAENAGNPDTVLEAYSALWHTDRVSLDVTASDIIEGEAGVWEVREDQAFYDSFSMSFGDAPLRHVTVSGTVQWTQEAEGALDVTGPLISAFGAAGNPVRTPFTNNIAKFGVRTLGTRISGGGLIFTFNGSSLKSSWPQPGTSIGGGWEVASGLGPDGKPLSYMLDAARGNAPFIEGYHMNLSYIGPPPADERPDPNAPAEEQTDFNVFINHGTWTWSFALNPYYIRMVVNYKASRQRTETVRAVLVADIMDQVADNSGGSTEEVSYSSDTISQGVDPGGGVPIGDPAFRSYFQTDRGQASFEYLLLAARAKLRAAARSVEITFGVDFPTAIAISLRHSVALFDRRIPGGSAVGKVKHCRILVGEGGMWGEFTLGATIGNGNPASAAIGIASYADDWVDPGYQVVAGSQYMMLADELAYQSLDQFVVIDDGLDLTNLSAAAVINSCTVTHGYTHQTKELSKFRNVSMPSSGLSDPWTEMKKMASTVTLDLKPVAGAEYHTDFLPAVSLLAIPQTIDLRAPPPGGV